MFDNLLHTSRPWDQELSFRDEKRPKAALVGAATEQRGGFRCCLRSFYFLAPSSLR